MPDRAQLPGLPRAGDELIVRAGISAWTGWEGISIDRSIESCCASFAVDYFDPRPLFVADGSRVQLAVGFLPEVGAGKLEVQVLDGRVDAVSTDDTWPDGQKTTVAGRDLLADLVDCSVTGASEWRGLDVVELARELAKPHGVEVVEGVIKTAGPVFDPFRINAGETTWQAIERACRLRSLLAFSNEKGQLVLERPGPRRADADLIWGENLLAARIDRDRSGRFRTYTVRGQGAGVDLDLTIGTQALPAGQATDPEIRPGRELLILAEGPVSATQATARARWEASVRAARASRMVVRVQGWRQWADGVLWKVNELVRVVVPHRRVDEQMLVTAVRFTRSADRGTLTELSLTRPDAYLAEAALSPDLDPFEEFTEDAEGLDDEGED